LEKEEMLQRKYLGFKWTEVLLLAVLAAQTFVIIYFNLTQLQHHIGFDTSSYFYTAVEMWNQKSLLLSSWDYQTTMAIDCVTPLAALFYGITKNIFVSYGLANSIATVVLIFIVNKLLSQFKVSRTAKLVSLNLLVVLHYSPLVYDNANSLSYGDVLFLQNGAYSVKVILSLLIAVSVLDIQDGKHNKWIMAFVAILSFISGLSSGYWILATVIVPILLLQIIKAVKNGWSSLKHNKIFIYMIILTVVSLAGKFAVVRFLGYESRDSGMILISIEEFWKNIGSILQGFFDLLTALPPTGRVLAVSRYGISYLLNFIFAVAVIAGCIKAIKSRDYVNNKDQVIFSIIGFDLLIFLILDTTYAARFFETRYLVVLYILGLIYFSKLYDNVLSKFNQYAIVLCTVAMLGVINVSSDMPFYTQKNNYETLVELAQVVDQHPSPTVYVYGDSLGIDARNLRVVDTSKIYKQIFTDLNVQHWGDTKKYDDLSEYMGPVILITHEAEYQSLPDRIKNKAHLVDESVDGYKIYELTNNPFDYVTGFNNDLTLNIDTPFSAGMRMADDGLNQDDSIIENNQSTGRYILYGPYTQVKTGTFNFTLHYSVDANNKDSYFDVATDYGANVLGSVALSPDNNKVTIPNVEITDPTDIIEYRVYAGPKEAVTVDYIEIERITN